MTITSTPSEISYAGDGVTLAFPIPFVFDAATDLRVTSTDADGNISVLTTGFSVSGGSGSTGTLTFTTAPAATVDIAILDNPEIKQATDYVSNDPFPAESHERALDRLTRICKRLAQQVRRSIRTQDGDPISDMTLGSVDNRKGKYLFFNAVTGAIEYAVSLVTTALSQSIIGQLLNPQTASEAAAGVVPTNYAYPYLHVERYSSVQVALNVLLVAGGTLTFEKGKTYSLTAAITLLRSSLSHATEMVIDGQGATLDFSGGTFTSDYLADQQSNLFSIGSVVNTADPANPQYIIELGLIAVRDLTIIGPEPMPPFAAPNPGVDVPETGTVGLRLQLAHNVNLSNIKITGCVVGMETKDSWDITANHVLVRNSWIGFSIHGGSTVTQWNECGAVQCCYSVIMRSWTKAAAPTYGAYAAVSAQTFINLRVENCWYGPILYPVDTAIRGCQFIAGYAEDITRDFFVSGFGWDQTQADDPASTLSIAVANTVDRLCVHYASRGASTTSPFEIFRAPTGASTNNVHCRLTLPRLPADLSAGFKSSIVEMIGNDTEAAGSIYMYDASGNLAYKQGVAGNILLGANKNTPAAISETGVELRTDGSVYATVEGDAALRVNRKSSTGGVVVFSQASNTIGSVYAFADRIAFNMNDAGVVWLVMAGSPEGAESGAPGSFCTDITNGVAYIKKTGTGNTGWKLVTQAA